MIPRTRPHVLLVSLLLAGLLTASLRAEIELKDGALFSLADPAAGTRSGWIGLRQEFGGYTLSSYDPKGDVLTLTKDSVKTELRLNAPKVQNGGRPEVLGAMTLMAGEKIDIERAALVLDEENIFPLRNGVTVRIVAKLTPRGNLTFALRFERPRVDGSLELLWNPQVMTLPGEKFSVQGSGTHPELGLGFTFTPTVAGSGPSTK